MRSSFIDIKLFQYHVLTCGFTIINLDITLDFVFKRFCKENDSKVFKLLIRIVYCRYFDQFCFCFVLT